MKITIKETADFIGGQIIGDSNLTISNVAKIEEAQDGDLTFLYLPAYAKFLNTTKASAIIINDKIERTRNDITYIIVKNPNVAFQKIIIKYFSPEFKLTGIDKTAHVDDTVKLGNNVSLGKNVVIEENCIIGDNTKIFHNSTVLRNSQIGANTTIFSNVSIREESVIGDNVIIHSGTVVGSDGFGFTPDENGEYFKVPQIGNVVIEDNVEIGSNASIDRAALGSTMIKRGAKIDNLVQIAHNVIIGENTVISAQTGVSGSTKVGKNCILAGQVGLVGHIELADGIIIGAQSGVSKSITKSGKYFGYPAKEWGTSLRLESHIRNLPKYSEKINLLGKQFEELKTELDKKGKEK